jgi:EAL domain-containing protein (putative c-di-GMP-specific phosphodiesterase class I)
MDTRADDASIVQAIVSLAHGLHLKVVAEGVETEAQLEALKGLGCDQYQGFYCSPALPPAEFERLLRLQAAHESSALNDPGGFQETWSKLSAIRKI